MNVWQSTCWPEAAQKRPLSSVPAPSPESVIAISLRTSFPPNEKTWDVACAPAACATRSVPNVERLGALELELDVIQPGAGRRAKRSSGCS